MPIRDEKIITFLKENNIDFALRGKNISNRVVCGINCPFCEDDYGHHLGIFREGFFTCWKNPEHRGSLFKLFSFLTGYSFDYLKTYFEDDFDRFADIIETENNIKKLTLPEYFVKIEKRPSTMLFYNYLKSRGFDDVKGLVDRYNILCCFKNEEWNNRIIFPVYINGQIVTWVGRAVSNNAKLRYKNLSAEKSILKTTDCLYNYDTIIQGGDILIITEGVFDAIKLDYYTSENIKVTCIFTSRLSEKQIHTLLTLYKKYGRIFIILDKDAYIKALGIKDELSFIKNIEVFILEDVKDPAELNIAKIKKLEEELNGKI
ncbi:MAG TPA: hypothetical protein PLH46_00810 [Caldisericia bacterium]|nr:hypothetical protein [Caldisericia bacterium]